MEETTRSVLLLCLLSLTNANSAPVINARAYPVCEATPKGVTAFKIDATDADNDPLTYTLSGTNAPYFKVIKNTGDVIVEKPLDREAGNVMNLDVVVSDGFSSTGEELTIILEDANDNKPIFENPSYDTEIKENTPVGTTLFKVHATDADTGTAGVVRYNIDEVIPKDGSSLFNITEITGAVILNGSLNYTSLGTSYRLKINATDGGGGCDKKKDPLSSVTFSIITVVDVPDLDPQFINLPYIGNVLEESSVGQSVLTVTALDQDTGINDAMIYSIEVPDGLFTISSEDGVISVLSPIDREAIGDTVNLTVKATESQLNINGVNASTTAIVLINIIDINDNKPEFYECGGTEDKPSCVKASHFTGEVFENSVGLISFNMTVRDPDKDSQTELSLEGTDKDVFSVVPKSTLSDSKVQLQIKKPEKLDFEVQKQMVLQVIAIDQGKTSFNSTATVTINIKDTNDNSPKFPKDTYKLAVPENSPTDTTVETITAEDPDTMDQGNLTYKLLPDTYFDVNQHTGAVYVKDGSLLDREVRSLFSATLQARDTDGKPGMTLLEITVTDINDEHPVFNSDPYLVRVKEGAQVEVNIQATDADEPGTNNSQIVYGIVPSTYSNNFTIDPDTGVLKNRGNLDREDLVPDLDGMIELSVTATDKGTPPQSSTATVIITVEDVNDNAPKFKASSYKFAVNEGVKGAYVGSVYAEDLDQTSDFNRISFTITDGSFGSFMIRSFAEDRGYRGNITVDRDIELDYESARNKFIMQVEAADLEERTAVVTVEVDILDVNDERPEFKPTPPVTVKENTTITGAIGRFIGYDKDGNNSLIYELVSMKCRCSGVLKSCNWFILDPTGEVRVNPVAAVDYEECDQAVIEAQVVDTYTEKGENSSATTGQMVINIEDINDNAPEFIPSDSVFVVVSEGASKGTSVAAATATDRDTGINRQIEFKVTKIQFNDANNRTTDITRMLFEAVTTQQKDVYVGIIQTTEGLDITLKGKYLVTVTATDTGGLSNSTVLEIFTVDESYKVELQFTKSVSEVEKEQNDIVRALTSATKAVPRIVAIRAISAETSRASPVTVVEVYFVYANGTALTSTEVEIMLSDPNHYLQLTNLGLNYIGKAPVNEPESNPVQYILLGIVGGLLIVLIVLITSLMCTRRNYKRKLKAAKAMNSASMVNSDNPKSGPVVPGTNKYTMEGANPVLNLNIDTAMVLGLDEESSDKVSLSSLDCSDYMTNVEKDTQAIMEKESSRPPEYIEPLGAALAQRGEKKDKARVGFKNPAFNTTDL